MKNTFKYWIMAIVAMFMMTSCSEEVGLDEGTTIKGNVEYMDGVAAGAQVFLTYGATEATADYDQVTVADADGNYHFDGLNNGDYFIDAKYTTPQDIEFNSPGFLVTIGGENDAIIIDFDLE